MSRQPTASATSLAEFALERARRRTCYVCNLPEEVRRQLEASKPEVSYRIIVEWLREVHGREDATRHKLEKHWQDGHVELDEL